MNPNKVTTTTRTTTTEFITMYTYASAGIAQCDLGNVKRTYADVSGSKVELAKNIIIVTQPLYAEE